MGADAAGRETATTEASGAGQSPDDTQNANEASFARACALLGLHRGDALVSCGGGTLGRKWLTCQLAAGPGGGGV